MSHFPDTQTATASPPREAKLLPDAIDKIHQTQRDNISLANSISDKVDRLLGPCPHTNSDMPKGDVNCVFDAIQEVGTLSQNLRDLLKEINDRLQNVV